jgi:dipeptidyl aminopeptidase/acylaminoacyl peptidase
MNCFKGSTTFAAFSAVCVLLTAAALAVEPQGIEAADLTRLRVIEALDVSPDGATVVCVVRGAERDALTSQWHDVRQLVLVDLVHDDRPPVQLTHGRRHDVAPVFGPRNTQVAFLRETEDAGLQVHVISISGGEPIRLATVPGGVAAHAGVSWSKDGRRLLVTGHRLLDAPPERSEAEGDILARLHANVASGDPRIERSGDHRRFGEDAMLQSSICLLDASDPNAPVKTVTVHPAREAIFDADDAAILCTWAIPDDTGPGLPARTVIARISLSGDGVPEVISSEPNWNLSKPRLSPDGSVIAMLGRSRHGAFLEPQRLGLVVPGEQGPHWLTGENVHSRSVIEFGWERGQDRLLFTTHEDGGIDLSMLSRTLLTEPRVLIESQRQPAAGVGAFSSGGAVVAYARTSVDAPSELWVLNASGQRRRWNPNPWLAGRILTLPESGWATPKGEPSVPWWLFRPEGLAPEADVPLVVLFHPGPGSMWGPGILECWFRSQWLTSQGWAVLYANPRGSVGYGQAERRRAFRDFSRGPSRDMLWAVDSMQEQFPGIGQSRVAMIGSSFGALAAGWAMAAGNVDAVILENGVFHVPTHLAQHDAWSAMVELLGGLPQDPVAHRTMLESDLLPHLGQIDSPVLLITMGETPAVEVESDLLYRLLALSHTPVERVRYTPSRGGVTLHQRLDEADRILIFLRDHLQNPPAAP